ncbi:TetR/AcrR family transcriptional regulator [Gemella sanguinis]|uniref:TetR/AcrR family transcriptional regulator n=1 Tax=Gemella sanguinis TaxID=84135 RepID=UPI0004E12212|nr:TetR/AcrR family transcriptional regulator [Gemella sanguinis]NKZ25671.1 TetR/AcrR family transcriptional regulator [Gemella sanguinis]
MAPKFKFTKEEVLAVTIDFIRENGIEALTARELAKKLDSSTKVIFSLFSNMKNLEDEAKFAAENIFSEKVNLALKDDSPFKRLGVEYILFSKNEPKLFQWLFMKKGIEVESFKDFLPMRDYEYKSVIESIDEEYKISIENAKKLYEHLFIYSHGIATLTVTGIHNFTATEIIEYMTEVTKSLIIQYLKEID